ncbi:hypothetical protein [Dictyobacter arantiisoli]|uniref:Bacterial spore germination immunoglobulin-like domain-containing protein n=1 Tax=Dictyobacter arantiisoli TaxID=2014874 RepID=A0A5A5TFB7_9CHLR|nr:hypothetical protein [Dictyobacter arantiisoli]GCF10112.1 hypothetical protein KDI_36760 [Dictyobacter arantiisoli]
MKMGQHDLSQEALELPEQHKRQKPQKPRPLTIILTILALLALAHFIAVNHVDSPPTLDDTRSCTTLLHNTDYTKVIPIQPRTQEMEAIQFINAEMGGQPAVLIQINNKGPQQKLDVYIYGCSLQHQQPVLNLFFKQQGIINGLLAITQANTLSIGQTDTTLPSDSSSILLLPLQQNVFQEYAWKNGSLYQTAFPGLYPVTSRSEAEALQDEQNHGQALPWTDPLQTASQMAEDLFKWPARQIHAILRKTNAREARVILEREGTRIEVAVSLTRLLQQNKNGLWWVTNAQTPGISLDQSQFGTPLSSPISIQGMINPTRAKVTATLFNHTLAPVHLQNDGTLQTDMNGQFTGSLAYTNVFPDQPGLLLITAYPDNQQDPTAQGYLLLTNLILG